MKLKNKNTNLDESSGRQHRMSPEESALKKRIYKMLLRNGHKKFANFFNKFNLKFNDDLIAAVDATTGTIYLNSWYNDNLKYFYQLDVLMRHEMGHVLLQHLAKATAEWTKVLAKGLGQQKALNVQAQINLSNLMHEASNILGDMEISNRIYSDNDKQVVANLILAGKVCHGIITEELRPSWAQMPLAEMIKAWAAEDADPQVRADAQIPGQISNIEAVSDAMKSSYSNAVSPSDLVEMGKTITDIHASSYYKKLPTVYKETIDRIWADFEGVDPADIKKVIKEITESNPTAIVIPKSPKTKKDSYLLATPEIKYFAVETLKLLANIVPIEKNDDYWNAYNKIFDEIDDIDLDLASVNAEAAAELASILQANEDLKDQLAKLM